MLFMFSLSSSLPYLNLFTSLCFLFCFVPAPTFRVLSLLLARLLFPLGPFSLSTLPPQQTTSEKRDICRSCHRQPRPNVQFHNCSSNASLSPSLPMCSNRASSSLSGSARSAVSAYALALEARPAPLVLAPHARLLRSVRAFYVQAAPAAGCPFRACAQQKHQHRGGRRPGGLPRRVQPLP